MSLSTLAVVFSKDRAFQLEATLASFYLHCRDHDQVEMAVLFRCSNDSHARQYDKLKAAYPKVRFIAEQNFRQQLLSVLTRSYILFLVDDNIFVRDFRVADCVSALEKYPAALGFSLRLGKNSTYCYALNRAQAIPQFEVVPGNTAPPTLRYRWVGTESDFGYPLEVSSSIYRVAEMGVLLNALQYAHPNSLEGVLAQQIAAVAPQRPELLCYETSVTFCNPINKVQMIAPDNRAGETVCHSADDLAKIFEEGGRLDVAGYSGFVPNACHQEVALKIAYPTAKTSIVTLDSEVQRASHVEVKERAPLVSVVIPAYKQAAFLAESVGSLLAQTYPNWECVIVNDGSPDNTGAVARALISQDPFKRISLIEKDNEGLAEARNTGIRAMRGSWILPLDSDDRFEPTMLEKVLGAALANPNVNIVSSWVRCFGAKSEIVPIRQYSRAEIMRDNVFPYASLYKRELWERFGGYRPIVPFGAEDYNFWISCSGVLNPYTVAEPLFLYRKHEGASMVDAVISHQAEVRACLHTCHPDLYTPQHLLASHDVLSAMQDDTRAVIDKHIARFPQNSELYLWRGLHHEAKNSWRQALRDFALAAQLASDCDWQPSFRMALLSAEKKELKIAAAAARDTLERCPAFPSRTQLEYLIAAA